jgi:hypothetical protein
MPAAVRPSLRGHREALWPVRGGGGGRACVAGGRQQQQVDRRRTQPATVRGLGRSLETENYSTGGYN